MFGTCMSSPAEYCCLKISTKNGCNGQPVSAGVFGGRVSRSPPGADVFWQALSERSLTPLVICLVPAAQEIPAFEPRGHLKV